MAYYILRIDDICPGTDKNVLRRILDISNKFGISPLLGIIPANEDENIKAQADKTFRDFEDLVNFLKKYNFDIAQHGVTHKLDPGELSSSRIHNYGELLGATQSEAENSLLGGKNILRSHFCKDVDTYMPPAHYLTTSIKSALIATNFRYVTDGFGAHPRKDKSGLSFIPQQLWRPRLMPMPGIFTICVHPNELTAVELEKLISFLAKNEARFISFASAKAYKATKVEAFYSAIFETLFWTLYRIKRARQRCRCR